MSTISPMQSFSSCSIMTAAEPLNCGAGTDLSIRELAEKIGRIVGFEGRLVFDPTKPDGTPRKLMDSSKIAAMGWKPRIGLDEGIAEHISMVRAE